MEIIKSDGKKIYVPGCADMGPNNESDHCVKRWQCRNGGDCLTGGIKKPRDVRNRSDETPGSRMEAGVPRSR